jgi:ABC-type dipeptide/oligopeptide/nickel transport system permease component
LTLLIPADPARVIVGPKGTPEQIAAVREELGLNDPMPVQYGRYLSRLVQLDLGYSYAYQREVRAILADRIPFTIALAAAALTVQLAIGIPVGLLSATWADGPGDRLALAWTMITIALPGFWIGLVLLYLLAFRWPLFPLGGADEPRAIVLPALALGLPGGAWYSRLVRDTALETLHGEFVLALRSRGLPPRIIVGKHVLRTVISPVLTLMAIDFGLFLGGAVLIESVFGWPGLGLTAYEAMQSKDIALLMATVLFGSFFVLVLNLLADLLRVWIDPRVHLG